MKKSKKVENSAATGYTSLTDGARQFQEMTATPKDLGVILRANVVPFSVLQACAKGPREQRNQRRNLSPRVRALATKLARLEANGAFGSMIFDAIENVVDRRLGKGAGGAR